MIRAILDLKKKLGLHVDEQFEGRPHSSSDGGHAVAENDESNWLVSYADMMTLLCGFFIMLFSMATLDEPKFEKVREALAEQFGVSFTPHPRSWPSGSPRSSKIRPSRERPMLSRPKVAWR